MKLHREPRSQWARYAYGYSDQKPWAELGILVFMIIFLLWRWL